MTLSWHLETCRFCIWLVTRGVRPVQGRAAFSSWYDWGVSLLHFKPPADETKTDSKKTRHELKKTLHDIPENWLYQEGLFFFRTDNQHFVLWHTSQRKKIEDDDEMRSDKLVPTVVLFQNCKTCLWVTLLLFRDPFLTSLHKYSPVQRFNCTAVLIWVSGGVFLCKLNRCQFGCQWFTDITQSQRS